MHQSVWAIPIFMIMMAAVSMVIIKHQIYIFIDIFLVSSGMTNILKDSLGLY